MRELKYLTLTFEGGSNLVIEGFGPHTIIGAVTDVLENHYGVHEGRKVIKIEITAKEPNEG